MQYLFLWGPKLKDRPGQPTL